MDEVLAWEARRMDSPALEDRHPLLNPQQWLSRLDLRQQESRPAAVARVGREQLGQGRAGRRGQPPTLTQLLGKLDFLGRTASAAADQGKACSHTTHNVLVLLLFFIRRLGRKSQSRDSERLFRNVGCPSIR